MLIGGKRVTSEQWVTAWNPARLNEQVGRFPQGRPEHAAAAVLAADDAFAGWRQVSVAERAECLRSAARAMMENVGAWQELFTREHGKIVGEAGLDIKLAAMVLDYYGSHPELLDERTMQYERGRAVVRQNPIGVCAAIVPWNWPVVLAATKIGPALLSGNTLVIKGPDHAAITLLLAVELIASFFPAGVLNIVSGQGPELGQALVNDPRVRKITLTGGTVTGRAVATDAAKGLKRLTLELGGNDAAILLPDLDVTEDVARKIVRGTYATSGQICFAIKRLYVPRDKYAHTVEVLSGAVDELVVGDGLEPDVTTGPVVNGRQHEVVRELLARTASEGLEVRELGKLHASAAEGKGYFIRPHLVLNPSDDSDVVTGEQFGPVLPVLPYDTEDEAIARANSSEYGLCSSLWSADEDRAFVLAERIEAGGTFINGHGLERLDFESPFGGVKSSGYGRELGPEALAEYVQMHTTSSRQN
jgi:acyl-CoA reductase-like NAD-dependent aldehyde dehydrogenase